MLSHGVTCSCISPHLSADISLLYPFSDRRVEIKDKEAEQARLSCLGLNLFKRGVQDAREHVEDGFINRIIRNYFSKPCVPSEQGAGYSS